MRESARDAQECDLDSLTRLAEELVAELSPTRGGALWATRESPTRPYDEYFRRWFDEAESLVAVGLIDDEIVAFITARVETLRDGTRLGTIHELFVEPPARAVGVGETLANHVIEWCVERGCVGVDARALPGNRAAKNFFETHGFVARSIVMHRPLPASD